MKKILKLRALVALLTLVSAITISMASSHREAPLIANDPLADNTDLYAFVSPDDPTMVTIIANYVPLQLPHGGPNYNSFGENVRYEIHIDNDVNTTGDDIIYRFTFTKINQDPTTFFSIRLGQENLKTSYLAERSIDGGATWTTIVNNGVVPPPNIGNRSIEGGAGLHTTYAALMANAITSATTGEQVFCGTVDDPFFVDLGGIFDLGDAPRQMGMAQDGVACKNVSSIVLQIPIATLQKDGLGISSATNILDGNFVIGVWASASRQTTRTLNTNGTQGYAGPWVQVSRLGMPLTNEVIIPIGMKDRWNALNPYQELDSLPTYGNYFYNPELGLYMDDALFGSAVPAFNPLRIQRNSLAQVFGGFDFGNGNDGLFPLKGSPAVAGTALDDAIFGTLLLPAAGSPRSVDLWPIFHTGVPNLEPYQLATGKTGNNPLTTGKPFINNFLPNGGDMLRLNMAVPATPRNSPDFSSEGLIHAAVLGLTDPTYNSSVALQFIPNMDGFPNGRRLEDDVTRIELQAVSGVVLAAIGLWYDDFDTAASPLTTDLLDVLTFTTGIESNDTSFQANFPYEQLPWSGTSKCGGEAITYVQPAVLLPTDTTTNPGVCNFNTLYLTLDLDDMGSEVTYQFLDLGGNVVASGGPFTDVTGGAIEIDTICLQDGCYELTITDAFGDGFAGGGYTLSDPNGDRIIDSDGLFATTSSLTPNFCVPIGDDGFIFQSCDKLDHLANGQVIAIQDPLVAAEFGIGDQTDDGYQFWFFDPHGSYSRRAFLSNANPMPGVAPGVSAAQYMKFGNLNTLPVPSNILLNVRVRAHVNGVDQEFGPACQFMIDAAAAACPTTLLVNDPNSQNFSCGVTRQLDAGQFIHAKGVTGANRYQFRFTDPNSSYVRNVAIPSVSLILNTWATLPLQPGVNYSVEVRASFDNGANYCPWGAMCSVMITGSSNLSALSSRSLTDITGQLEVTLYPNPNLDGYLRIDVSGILGDQQTVEVQLYNMQGQKVQTNTFTNNGPEFNAMLVLDDAISDGMYIVRLHINDQLHTAHLMVQ